MFGTETWAFACEAVEDPTVEFSKIVVESEVNDATDVDPTFENNLLGPIIMTRSIISQVVIFIETLTAAGTTISTTANKINDSTWGILLWYCSCFKINI